MRKKIVSPYRSFPTMTVAHVNVGPFDWIEALRLLRRSGQRLGLETYALTSPDEDLGVPAYAYPTTTDALTVWIVETCLRYLESDDFDADTAMISPDMLVIADPFPWLAEVDLVMAGRFELKYRNAGRPLLFGAQLWAHAAKDRLIALYRQALVKAQTVATTSGMWGADIEPFLTLFAPLMPGRARRAGLRVRLVSDGRWMATLSGVDIRRLEQGQAPSTPTSAIMDFRYTRKRYQRAYFEAVMGATA